MNGMEDELVGQYCSRDQEDGEFEGREDLAGSGFAGLLPAIGVVAICLAGIYWSLK